MEVEHITLTTPFDFTELEKIQFVLHDEGPDYMIDFAPLSEKEFSFLHDGNETV